MWTTEIQVSEEPHVLTFKIKEHGEQMPHHRFLTLLSTQKAFISWYNQQLATCGFDAFFWENKPITTQNVHEVYECSLINSETLTNANPDRQTFSAYFKDSQKVVSFWNLGGDAQLIAPCPHPAADGYAHIGSFVRKAPHDQILDFWKKTAKKMLDQMGEKPKWLSTSGLGVYWLHARIDSTPKYYQTTAYRTL